jgi:hypothetical protein
MYYLVHRADLRDDYQPGQPRLDADDLQQIRQLAQASCLEATAWGVAYPDLTRVLLPMLANRVVDRGWAVEQMWRRRMDSLQAGDGPAGDWRLNDMVAAIEQNHFPVVVFNATLVETGQRLLISPVVAGRRSGMPDSVVAQEFLQMFPASRTRVSTAVRLSATFPYVSPICRAFPEEPYGEQQRFHVADGGYADNDGLVTVIDWLDRLGTRYGSPEGPPPPFDRVLLVQIRPFPDSDPPAPREKRGWLYATAGPLVTMTNVRKTSQAERANLEVGMLRQLRGPQQDPRTDDRATGHWNLPVESVQLVFQPSGSDTDSLASLIPLSWKLTPRQKRAVRDAWHSLVSSQATRADHPLKVIDRYFPRRQHRSP